MQIHLIPHGIEHIRELRMECKDRRLVKIGRIQILVFRFLHETVIRHIDPVNTTFSTGILQNRIYQTTGIPGTFHVHQFHPRFETKQTVTGLASILINAIGIQIQNIKLFHKQQKAEQYQCCLHTH